MLTSTGAYAAAQAANDLVVTDYRLSPPNWPEGRRLTITVVADLHAGGPNMGVGRVRQVVDSANALGSDLVVVLGDYFATHRFITEHVTPPAWAAELARLRAPLGVYAILGNHDWWHGVDGVRNALRNVGVPLLQNSVVHVASPDHRFWLAGLDDQIAHRLGPSRFRGEDDLPGTLARITTDDPVILLAHEPDIFVEVPTRVALTIAGHTHGGQILLAVWPPALGAVGLWRALRLRSHRRKQAPHDRLRWPRLQRCAAAPRCAAGDRACNFGRLTCGRYQKR